jgi:hypothetical protein
MIRRPLTVAAVSVAGLLALAACGSESETVVEAAAPAPQSPTPFEVYYDLTHPDVVQPQTLSPFEVYYDLTHPDAVTPQPRAPESVNQLEHRALEASRQRAPESVNQLEHRALEASRQRVPAPTLQQVADYAQSAGLTGLSPAFLQPAPVQK